MIQFQLDMRSLDLSNKGLSAVLPECLDAEGLRQALGHPSAEDTTHLYLNGNGLTAVPIWTVLEVFPNLVWLDLRNNQIKSLGGNVDFDTPPLSKADKHLKIQVSCTFPPKYRIMWSL